MITQLLNLLFDALVTTERKKPFEAASHASLSCEKKERLHPARCIEFECYEPAAGHLRSAEDL